MSFEEVYTPDWKAVLKERVVVYRIALCPLEMGLLDRSREIELMNLLE